MESSRFTFANPGETVAARANLAQELFTLVRDSPFHETTTTGEPVRSSSTTTVERRAGLSTRAIALTNMATGDLAFFRARELASPAAFQLAENALGKIYAFLRKNRSRLAAEASRDAAFARRELAAAREESAELEKTLRDTKDSEVRSAIAGRINLASLRIARLQRLSEEAGRAAQFYEQLDTADRTGRR